LLVAPALVGGSHAASLGKHLGKSIAYDENASGSCLAAEAVPSIATPWGAAVQSTSAAAVAARAEVQAGATLWRIGTTGASETTGAQFWALENPLNPGFAGRYGIPPANVANANFIQSATLQPGASFITRVAPGFGPNPGGGIEVVVAPGDVTLGTFSGL
jgi:hypothetical protein